MCGGGVVLCGDEEHRDDYEDVEGENQRPVGVHPLRTKFYISFFSEVDNLEISSQSHKIAGHGNVRKSGVSGGGLEQIFLRFGARPDSR